MEVFSLMFDLAMQLCQNLSGLVPAMTALLLPRDGLLRGYELLFRPSEMPGVIDERSIGECSEVRHTQVNAHIFIACWQWFRVAEGAAHHPCPHRSHRRTPAHRLALPAYPDLRHRKHAGAHRDPAARLDEHHGARLSVPS